jgi:aminoglycoside phosphotransferase (APT) family kinase protein
MGYQYYETEVNFYREMAAEIPLRTPEIYVSAMDPDSDRVLIIMEAFTGWHSPDQVLGAEAEQVEIAVAELAGLAAAYWNDQPCAQFPWLKSADAPAFATLAEDHANCLPAALERFAARWGTGSEVALNAISQRYPAIRQAIINATQVLSHWDYRVENLFFGADGEFAVIDWQLMHMDNPANDLAYLLATNVDVTLRREIEADMMTLYLSGLRDRGITSYGIAELVADYRLALLSLTAIPVIGGANMDMGNERSQALFAAMGHRLLSAIDDWQALDLLERL